MRLRHWLAVAAGTALLVTGSVATHRTQGGEEPVLRALDVPAAVPATSALAVQDAGRSAVVTRSVRRGALSARTAAAVDPRWARRTATAAQIPLPALTAYARASVLVPASCRISWTTLAGVGWIESQHGTLGGRRLRRDGQSSAPILGPALDGSEGFAAIEATRDSARWHGDRVWDHAVGPMQFIPSTWRTWQVDGDGDGAADPNDLDDAALAAARYLCQSGDLMSGDNWSQAILRYNNSLDYVLDVYTAADLYADRTN